MNQYSSTPMGKKNPETKRLTGITYSMNFWIMAA